MMETCPLVSCYPTFDPAIVITKRTKLPDCSHFKGGEVKQFHRSPTFNVQPPYTPTSYMDAVVNGQRANPLNVAPSLKYELIEVIEESKDNQSSVKSQPSAINNKTNRNQRRQNHRDKNLTKHCENDKTSESWCTVNTSVNRFQCLREVNIDRPNPHPSRITEKPSIQNPPKVRRTFVSQNVKQVKDAAPNYLDLFAAFVNQNDPKVFTPQQDVFNAKHYLINETSDELIIGDSHMSRLLNNWGKNQSTFLIYPGVVLTKEEEFN